MQYKKRKMCCINRKYTVNRTEFVKDTKQKRLGWERSQSLSTILWFYSGKGKGGLGSKGSVFSRGGLEAAQFSAIEARNKGRPQDS